MNQRGTNMVGYRLIQFQDLNRKIMAVLFFLWLLIFGNGPKKFTVCKLLAEITPHSRYPSPRNFQSFGIYVYVAANLENQLV